MSILGNYVLFFISMVGITLADNDDKYQQFYQEMLMLHNVNRANHNAGILTLDMKLCNDATKIAMAENEGQLYPSHDESIGYNVFYEYPNKELDATVIFNSWYNEGQNYSNTEDIYMREKTSSFTQIVWQSTIYLGVAVYPGNPYVIIVTTYSPRGNIDSEYEKNVVAIVNPEDDTPSSSSNKRQRTVY